MDIDDTSLTLVEKIGSRKGRVTNLTRLRKGIYDLVIYQECGDIRGSYFGGLSLQDIGLFLETMKEGEFCVCPSNKQWVELQWD